VCIVGAKHLCIQLNHCYLDYSCHAEIALDDWIKGRFQENDNDDGKIARLICGANIS
jgi:hypothetical protein